jgi:hypothetical protein
MTKPEKEKYKKLLKLRNAVIDLIQTMPSEKSLEGVNLKTISLIMELYQRMSLAIDYEPTIKCKQTR